MTILDVIINIGDTDENADWIKSLPGHEDELRIHEELAEEYAEDIGDEGHASRPAQAGAA